MTCASKKGIFEMSLRCYTGIISTSYVADRGFIRFLALLLLGFYLYRVQHRREETRIKERQARLTGATIDTSNIGPRLEKLRANYIPAHTARKPSHFCGSNLLASAREALNRLGYFRNHSSNNAESKS